ncbi:hypothetical protein [Dyadobacter sandarakinus]|uniref:Uncharacterized protein n=1 Tax=Dyadobacter sandarakinus TaxID=2747268 RepID=A0ABX7I1Y5_9BACT|nr:hypothetical protein [Dyadobacter sandarakinus]QRQ99864.1 hypothetical protein HWI92_02490 [Dyadobacter sandarakinus]
MKHEKEITLETGRAIKIIMEGSPVQEQQDLQIDLDVLIKDPKDKTFHRPIENTHPKYWKLKSMDERQSKLMQIKYSGLPDKQIRKALKEFLQMLPN